MGHVAALQPGQRFRTGQLLPPIMCEDWENEGSPQGELAREWDLRRDQHYNVIVKYRIVVNQQSHRAGADGPVC